MISAMLDFVPDSGGSIDEGKAAWTKDNCLADAAIVIRFISPLCFLQMSVRVYSKRFHSGFKSPPQGLIRCFAMRVARYGAVGALCRLS